MLAAFVTAGVTLAGTDATLAKHQWENYHLLMPSDSNGDATGPTAVTVNFHNSQFLMEYRDSLDEWNGVIGNPDVDCSNGVTPGSGNVVVDCNTAPGSLSSATENGSFDPNGNTFLARFTDRMTESYGGTPNPPPNIVNSFNGDYGNTGWLGVAVIDDGELLSAATTHIIYGEIFINDCYDGLTVCFPIFADPLDRKYVFCQEFGHVLGLDHVKRDTGTCMFTPRGTTAFGSLPQPNPHDGATVNEITHSESAHGTGGVDDGGPKDCNPKSPKCTTANPTIIAFWAENFGSEENMFDAADAVVGVTVLQGSTFDRSVGAAGLTVPISQVVLKVSETFKGDTKSVITLEQSRGSGFEIVDDPAYVRGDDYVLYLRSIDANTYRIVSPDGRIRQ